MKKKNSVINLVRDFGFLSGVKNPQRRNFLKYSAFAIGGFLAGKFLDYIQGLFSSKKGFELVGPQGEETRILENFVLKETKKELNISDKQGNEIFIIEKE